MSEEVVDSKTNIELLERNLRYIQEQHECTLSDLHQEINRLQTENQNLQYRLRTSNDDLEEKLLELKQKLGQSEQRNDYLTNKLSELNQIIASTKTEQFDSDESSQIDPDYQQFTDHNNEKEKQYLQEIAKLRSVIFELINTERLSSSSRTILRDCLTSSNFPELAIHKITTTPTDQLLFANDRQQSRTNMSPSFTAKMSSLRSELPVRRLTISPPRLIETRTANLPMVNSALSQNRSSSSAKGHYQCIVKIGETPIARRERRNQEIQRNRLMKNFYH